MIFRIICLVWVVFIYILSSCEQIIDVELETSASVPVVEASIFKDSVCQVHLSQTVSYFSRGEYDLLNGATIKITDGTYFEELENKGDGYYRGKDIIGTVGRTYEIEILHNNKTYNGYSFMTEKSDIISVQCTRSDSPGLLNPNGKTVLTITCKFMDNPYINNFYMIRFLSGDKMIENYYPLTENSAYGGSLSNVHDTLSFSESIFYDGHEAVVQLFSIDESVYKYFVQLNDVLFWKRRVMPPTPYNPVSNLSNGVLGYFAAWSYDSKKLTIE